MKKRTTWLVGISILILLVAAVGFGTVWNDLSDEWSVEARAAQFALNHSPLTRIDRHDIFTGDQAQEVFQGVDVFGRRWYVFVYGNPFTIQSVPAKDVIRRSVMEKVVSKQGLHIVAAHVGYISGNLQSRFSTHASIVWEVYGSRHGKTEYLYLNAQNGKTIWYYVL